MAHWNMSQQPGMGRGFGSQGAGYGNQGMGMGMRHPGGGMGMGQHGGGFGSQGMGMGHHGGGMGNQGMGMGMGQHGGGYGNQGMGMGHSGGGMGMGHHGAQGMGMGHHGAQGMGYGGEKQGKQKDKKSGKKKDKKDKKGKGEMGYQHQRPQPPAQDYLTRIFNQVDRDRSGEIDAKELQNALSNGSWVPFNIKTVNLMISLFDRNYSGTINAHEFGALWKYIQDWQSTFQQFDQDRSGNIDRNELRNALTSFGYKLSDAFYDSAMLRFDRTRSGKLNFDDFIGLCLILQMLTGSFREKDTDSKGVIRISFEEYINTFSDHMFRTMQ